MIAGRIRVVVASHNQILVGMDQRYRGKAEEVRVPGGGTVVFDAPDIPASNIDWDCRRIVQLDPVRVLANILDYLPIAGHDLINHDLRVAVRDQSDIYQGRRKPAMQVGVVQGNHTLPPHERLLQALSVWVN